jgi:isocitrate dehydrogenase
MGWFKRVKEGITTTEKKRKPRKVYGINVRVVNKFRHLRIMQQTYMFALTADTTKEFHQENILKFFLTKISLLR